MIEHDMATKTIRFSYEVLPGEWCGFSIPDRTDASIPLEWHIDRYVEDMIQQLWKRIVEK